MEGYLGEFDVDVSSTEFKDFTPSDWAMYFIERYGQIDGAHHKTWVLDQVARILKGTSVTVKIAKWEDGTEEYRVSVDKNPSEDYVYWAQQMLGEFDGEEYEYSYDEGIAP